MADAIIRVRYRSIDGCGVNRSFKTLEAARAFAAKWVGAHPEIGRTYAVSGDGVGKVTVQGATLAELFPSPAAPPASARRSYSLDGDHGQPDPDYEAWCDRQDNEAERQAELEAAKAHAAEADALARPYRSPGCRCSDQQLALVGCDCDAERTPNELATPLASSDEWCPW